MKWKLPILITTMLILAALIVFSQARIQQAEQKHSVANAATKPDPAFAQANTSREFLFPDDHGPHPDYQTEWWYYTGNLVSDRGEHFGYQLTFFRRALIAPVNMPPRTSEWATNQFYMAHFALTDTNQRQHQAFERFSRGALGLAGAQAQPFRVWLEDWYVSENPTSSDVCASPASRPCQYLMYVEQEDIKLELTMTDMKGPVLQGNDGLSLKGSEPGQGSYYYSLTRLNTTGTIRIGDQTYQVGGTSWMDHEFSTSVLSVDQVGWDWFSIQLEDDSELMLFQIRSSDGSIDPYSSGIRIDQNGKSTTLSREDFFISSADSWKSPHSGAIYPSKWIIDIPAFDLTIELKPVLLDQELNLSYTYWEGAVDILGRQLGNPISGTGYVEMTGYSTSMGGEF